jgi:hypothetical protein
MYVCMPPRSSMRPTGVPVCFTPEKQQAAGAEASVGDIVETWCRDDNLVAPFNTYTLSCCLGRSPDSHSKLDMRSRGKLGTPGDRIP